MKKVNIDSFCDYCLQQKDTYVPSVETFTLACANVVKVIPLHTLDACEVHAKPLYELTDIVRLMGAPLDPSSQPEEDRNRQCPVCMRTLRSSVTDHLVRLHNLKKVTQPKTCPDCGAKAKNERGMIGHRNVSHGYSVAEDMVNRLKSK